MNNNRISAIVLAAGMSVRFGTGTKALATLNGKPLVAHVLDALARSRVTEIIVVASDTQKDVTTAIMGDNSTRKRLVRLDPSVPSQMSRSLQAGINALGRDVDGALVCLADMPFITAELVDRIIDALTPNASAVVPTHNRQWGNPVLLARRIWPEIKRLSGDEGAKRILKAHPDHIVFVETESDLVFMDVDTPEDLARAEEALDRQTSSSPLR